MATNHWKNITTAVESKIRASLKCSVYSGWKDEKKGNEFIKLIPVGSNSLEKATFLESREYEFNLQYYFLNRNNQNFKNLVFTRVAQLQDLFSESNITIDLADSSQLIDVTLESLNYNVEPDEELEDYFLFEWNLTGKHYA